MTVRALLEQFTGSTRLLTEAFGSAITYSISGNVSDSEGPIAGVSVSDGSGSTTTDSSGNYTLSGRADGSYTITPTLTGYTFSPANRSVTVSGANVAGRDFAATAVLTGSARIAGDSPDGLVLSSGVAVQRPIRLYYRRTGELVAQTTSESDGTWEFAGLSTLFDFDVQILGTEAGERDLHFPKVRAS